MRPRAAGQSTDLVPDIAAAAITSWRSFFDRWDRAGLAFNFLPERRAPADGCAADHLAAYLGRRL